MNCEKKNFKVSVIIPVYNVEKYLRQCVDSVLNQTYQNIEVILVDDGSPDHCPEICDDYAQKDIRVKVLHKDNGGLSSARNAGVEMATGEYGIFIDSDDYWKTENGLEVLINRVEDHCTDVLSFGYEKYDEESKVAVPYFQESIEFDYQLGNKVRQLDELTRKNLYIASACNKLIRMSILRGVTFEQGMVSEDVEWCARLMTEADSFDFVNLNFYCYRQRSGSISHTISPKSCIDLKNAVIGCSKIAQASGSDIQEYVYRYTAYQFAAFIAVQAFTKDFQTECISSLRSYTDILQYYGQSKKIKYMYLGTRIFGLKMWCIIIKSTRKIWDKMR